MKRRVICELIQRRLANGTPDDTFEPSLYEINRWLDYPVGVAAWRNYTDTAQVDVEIIGDAYYATYKGIPLSSDADMRYKALLPALPLSVPRGFDISDARLEYQGVAGKPLIRITPQQQSSFEDLIKPKNYSFYRVEGSSMVIESDVLLDDYTVRVTMAGSCGNVELDDEFLCPDDAITFVVDWVFNKFLGTINLPKDNMNDGLNLA